jgi:cytoskeleton protein RodZ
MAAHQAGNHVRCGRFRRQISSSAFTGFLYYIFRSGFKVMSSVGETLRQERLRKDLKLEQIAGVTRISARFLDAIENDQFDLLPGGVFTKSFVRQYARFLGLDEEALAAAVASIVHPAAEGSRVAGWPRQPTFKVPRMDKWEGRSRSQSSVLPALAMVVTVMLVCAALYAWWQRSRRPPPVAHPVAAARKTPVTASPSAKPAPSSPPAASPEVTPPPPESDNTATALPVLNNGRRRVIGSFGRSQPAATQARPRTRTTLP